MTYAEVALVIEGYCKRFGSAVSPEDDRPEVDPAEVVAAMLRGATGAE